MTTFAVTVRTVKTPSERGPFGAWLVEQRTVLSAKRGRKVLQRDVVSELAQQGYPIEESYYRALEGGSKTPGRDLRDRLAAFFGNQPPPARSQPGDLGQLVGALREQTAAINELVQMVRLALLAQVAGDEATLREQVEALVRAGGPAPVPGAPQPGTRP